ncbi:hypothetical protein K0M31_017929 [Melipona bicolor]|uniref:Uncharacterized protein n=1 Tax=Melipona bicolor TaxID=60889 RepID=A0AA40KSY1_9HYME|nr:hypothetical protein K0M31_017929 [Melipona bicolor]
MGLWDPSQLLPLCADRTCIMSVDYGAYQISLKRAVATVADASRKPGPLQPPVIFAPNEWQTYNGRNARGIRMLGHRPNRLFHLGASLWRRGFSEREREAERPSG